MSKSTRGLGRSKGTVVAGDADEVLSKSARGMDENGEAVSSGGSSAVLSLRQHKSEIRRRKTDPEILSPFTANRHLNMPATLPMTNMADETANRHDDLMLGCDAAPLTCTPCEQKNREADSRSYCVTCQQHLCVRCERRHKEHVLFKNSHVPGMTSVLNRPKNEREHCEQHGELIDSHCRSHDCLCCRDCVKVGHLHCTIQTISELVTSCDVESLKRNVLDSTQAHMKSLMKKRQTWTSNKTLLVSEKEKQIQDIKRLSDELVQKIRQLEDKCLSDITRRFGVKVRELDDKLVQLNKYLKKLRDDIRLAGEPRIESRERKILNLKGIQDRLKSMHNYKYLGENTAFEEKQDNIVNFRTNATLIDCVNRANNLGSIFLDGESENALTEISQYSAHVEQDRAAPEATCMAAIDVLKDGRIVVADVGNKKLKILDHGLQLTESIKLSSSPRGVSANRDLICVVALPDEGCVQLYSMDPENISAVKKLSVHAECTDIVAFEKDMILCCHDHLPSPLMQMDFDGNVLRHIDLQGMTYRRPNYICCSPDRSKVYLSDADEGVLCLDLEETSKWAWKYKHDHLLCPLGITVDNAGSVYIADYLTSSVCRLNPDGKFETLKIDQSAIGLASGHLQSICFSTISGEFFLSFDESYQVMKFKLVDVT